MGEVMDETAVAGGLRRSGLIFLGWREDSASLVPPAVARYAVACGSETGRTDVMLKYSDSQWREKANDAWHSLALESGLFGDAGEFLVAVALEPKVWPVVSLWASVRLGDNWDVAGAGADGLLGSGEYQPEFVMLSSSGDVIVRGTVWQDGIGFLAVPRPWRAAVLRQQAESLANWDRADPGERQRARAWLDEAGERE